MFTTMNYIQITTCTVNVISIPPGMALIFVLVTMVLCNRDDTHACMFLVTCC